MSSENVDVVRRSYAAFNSGDWDGALESSHPEIEWRLQGELGFDVRGPVRGREALKVFWADFFDIWDDYTMEPLDFIEAPGGVVVVTVRFTARGQGSSVPIDLTYFHVYHLIDGKVVSVDLYTDRREALEAAKLTT